MDIPDEYSVQDIQKMFEQIYMETPKKQTLQAINLLIDKDHTNNLDQYTDLQEQRKMALRKLLVHNSIIERTTNKLRIDIV